MLCMKKALMAVMAMLLLTLALSSNNVPIDSARQQQDSEHEVAGAVDSCSDESSLQGSEPSTEQEHTGSSDSGSKGQLPPHTHRTDSKHSNSDANAVDSSNNSPTPTTVESPAATQSELLLHLIAAEMEELDNLVELSQRKLQLLASAREAVLSSTSSSSTSVTSQLMPVDQLLDKIFGGRASSRDSSSAVPPASFGAAFSASSTTPQSPPPFGFQHNSPQAFNSHPQRPFEEFVLLKSVAEFSSEVVNVFIIPLAIYNPYSRSMASGAEKAPHAELAVVVDTAGRAVFYSSDGLAVANVSIATLTPSSSSSATDCSPPTVPAATAPIAAADYTFTQSSEKTLVGVIDVSGEFRLYKFNVWFDHFPILGGKVPVRSAGDGVGVVELSGKPSDPSPRGKNGASSPSPAESSGPAVPASTAVVQISTQSAAYTVALTPLLRIPLAMYDVDPQNLVLYSWRANVFAITTTQNKSTLLFVNRTGHVHMALDMARIFGAQSGNDVEGSLESESQIVRYYQLGPRLAIAFGNTVYFYHVERQGFESTRCVGLLEPLVDFAFDAVTPAHIYASVRGGVLVFDVTGKSDAPNPCVILRRIGMDAHSEAADTEKSDRAESMPEQEAVDSVPGYFVHVRRETISIFNASRGFQHVATSSALETGARQNHQPVESVHGPRPLVRVSPVGRGWARKSDPGGADGGNFVAIVSADHHTVRFFHAMLPYTPETTDMSWMRYPMIGVTVVIVLFTMFQRCGGRSRSPADMPADFMRSMPNIGANPPGGGGAGDTGIGGAAARQPGLRSMPRVRKGGR